MTKRATRTQDHPLPPPVHFLAAFLAGVALDRWLPLPLTLPALLSPLAWLLLSLSALAAGTAFASLLRARTTIRLDRPPTAFVATGPYRFSRNPMYLSLVLLYSGLAILIACPWALLLLPVPVWTVNARVIPSEEEQLRHRFGASYSDYCARVRRWL